MQRTKTLMGKLFFIFVLTFISAAMILLTACNSATESGATDATEAGSDPATQKPTEEVKVDDGINRIFADGDFACRFIRGENATDAEKEIYNALRDKVAEITGKRPRLNTDFLALGETYDPNEFAILIGKTDTPESKELYNEIDFGDASVKFIGRKLVFGFHNTDAALLAVEALGEMFASAFDGKTLIYEESMSVDCESDGIINSLPGYSDGEIAAVVDGGNGSATAIIDSTTLEAFNEYAEALVSEDGYTLHAQNEIGDNRFATYISEEYTITAMHTPATEQTRLTIDLTEGNPQPATQPEEFVKICDSTVTQMGVESTGRQNGMSYIIKLDDGSFMVFDGGDQRCIDLFMTTIESLADDKDNIVIAAWVITHLHNDHAYLIRDLGLDPEILEKITVERFIWNRPSDLQIENTGSSMEQAEAIYQGMLKFEGAQIYTARAGQVYYIRNAVYTVYSTSEMLEPFVMGSYNDACVVGLLEVDGRRLFFPGDSDRTQTTNLVTLYGEELKCDVLQVIHHGHNGGDTTSYKLFDPITVLWPVGSNRYYNEWDGNKPFKDWACNEWFFNDESSTEVIYVAGKDVVTLVIKDLPVHEY